MMPHSKIPNDPSPADILNLPKSPLKANAFPEQCPPGCERNCRRFYQQHGRTLSFALYATTDPALEPRTICVYAFSCGIDIEGEKATLKEGETPVELVRRVVPILIKHFEQIALSEKEILGVKDN